MDLIPAVRTMSAIKQGNRTIVYSQVPDCYCRKIQTLKSGAERQRATYHAAVTSAYYYCRAHVYSCGTSQGTNLSSQFVVGTRPRKPTAICWEVHVLPVPGVPVIRTFGPSEPPILFCGTLRFSNERN